MPNEHFGDMTPQLLPPYDTSQLATSDMRNVVTHQSAMIAVCASRANHRKAIDHKYHILQATAPSRTCDEIRFHKS